MNTCHICDRTALNGPKPHSVRMPRMAIDEKLAYVESVLDVLIDSRYGPWYLYSYLDQPDYGAADGPVSFLDLVENQGAAWYATGVLASKLRRPSTGRVLPGQNPARSKGISLQNHVQGKGIGWLGNIQGLANLASNPSPSSLARGSPPFRRRTSSFASPLRP